MERFRFGQIVKTQGLKGEVRIYPFTDDLHRFDEIQWFYLGENSEEKSRFRKIRYQKNLVIAEIEGISSLEEAEKCIGKILYIDRENLRELEEDEYMISDLIDLDVYLESGEAVGRVFNVLQYSANDIYVIKNKEGKEFLIPALKQFVPVTDLKQKKMILRPIKGMIDL